MTPIIISFVLCVVSVSSIPLDGVTEDDCGRFNSQSTCQKTDYCVWNSNQCSLAAYDCPDAIYNLYLRLATCQANDGNACPDECRSAYIDSQAMMQHEAGLKQFATDKNKIIKQPGYREALARSMVCRNMLTRDQRVALANIDPSRCQKIQAKDYQQSMDKLSKSKPQSQRSSADSKSVIFFVTICSIVAMFLIR